MLIATACSSTAKVTPVMDDSVRSVRDRLETVARASRSAADLERRILDGESYTLLLLDAKPFPSTVITAVRREGERVDVEMYTTGQGSSGAGWFGDESVNAVGCARLTARPGRNATATGVQCGDTVRAVFVDPWVEVRLRP